MGARSGAFTVFLAAVVAALLGVRAPGLVSSPASDTKSDSGSASSGKTPDEPELTRDGDSIVNDIKARLGVHANVIPLIITAPDPVESRIDYQFDLTMAAVQGAAAAAGFSLDRWWMPWLSAIRDPRQKPGPRSYVAKPGVVAFRKERASERPSGAGAAHEQITFLVVFVVGELPTGQLQKVAFEDAVKRSQNLLGSVRSGERKIRILGPTFSGTAAALKRVLESDALAKTGMEFQIISGSATAAAALQRLTGDHRTFSATVVPDNRALIEVSAFLKGTLGIDSSQTALLVENNTTYGVQGFMHDGQSLADRIVPFPMHVSLVRNASDRQRGVGNAYAMAGVPVPKTALDLATDEHENARDVLPIVSPITTNYEEEVLSEAIAAIGRSGIRAVGVVASDSRDKRFLIRKVREWNPDAVVFTLGSDVLLSHPQDQAAMFGTLVVSSYPLLTDVQAWFARKLPLAQSGSLAVVNGGARELLQFGNTEAQGVFNAALALLSDADEDAAKLPLADYGSPYDGPRVQTQPPIWISVVGRSGIWPLTARRSAETVSQVYSYETTGAVGPAPSSSRLFSVSFVALAILVLLVSIGFHASRRGATGSAVVDAYQPAPDGRRLDVALWIAVHAGVLVAAFLGMALITLVPAVVHTPLGGATEPELTPAAWGWSTSLVGAVAVFAVGAVVTATPAMSDRLAGAALPRRLAAMAALGMILFTAVALVRIWATAYLFSGTDALLWFVRATHPGGGASPLMPLLFVGIGLFGVSFVKLRSIRRVSVEESIRATLGAIAAAPLGEGRDAVATKLTRRLTEAVAGRLPVPVRAGILGIAAVLVLTVRGAWVSSPDGTWFDAVYLLGVLALGVLVVAALARAWFTWRALNGWLRLVSSHPMLAALENAAETYSGALGRWSLLDTPRRSALQVAAQLLAAVDGKAATRLTTELELERTEQGRQPLADSAWTSRGFPVLQSTVALLVKQVEDAWRAGKKTALDLQREVVIAAHFRLCVAWVVVHIRGALFLAALGSTSVLLSTAFYPFQAPRLLVLLIWPFVLATAISFIVIVVQLDRNEVMSDVTGTKSGSLTLDAATLARFAGTALVPLAALIAVQFPAVGRWFVAWLDPFLRVIK